ncbi:MAG: flagellar basal body rod protein FlgC [Sphingobium sp.]
MSMDKPMSIFDISGRAMSAQLVRLNATASNMANAGTVAGSAEGAYRAIRPVFTPIAEKPGVSTVTVKEIVSSDTPATKRHDPGHPLADANGDVWESGVDSSAELVDMVDASRMYQNNVQVLNTAKSLVLETLRIGK